MKQRLLYILAIVFATMQTFAQGKIKYEYDDNNRLTKVTYGNGSTETFTYDELGNRLTMKVVGSGSTQGDNIVFADAKVKEICVANWDTNHDGELSKDEAAAVTTTGLDYKFRGNTEITSFDELPYFTNLTDLATAFKNCSNLTSITIPKGVTNVGAMDNDMKIYVGPFAGCKSLTSLKVEEGNPIYDSRNDCNAIIETATNTLVSGCQNTEIPTDVTAIEVEAFSGCTGLTAITIPEGVQRIGASAFKNCTGLTSITIPKSVTTLGNMAYAGAYFYVRPFTGCSGLTSVIVDIEEPLTTAGTVFYNAENAILYVPKGSKTAYAASNSWNNFKKIVEMGDTNGDGMFTMSDFISIMSYILGDNPEDFDVTAADLNGDGSVTVIDALLMLDLIK